MIKLNKAFKVEADDGRVFYVKKVPASMAKHAETLASEESNQHQQMMAACYIVQATFCNEDGTPSSDISSFTAEQLADEVSLEELLELTSLVGKVQTDVGNS